MNKPLAEPSLFVGLAVSFRGVLVCFLTVFLGRGCMFLALVVATMIMMVGGLPVMVRRRLVVRGRVMMMFGRGVGVFWHWALHKMQQTLARRTKGGASIILVMAKLEPLTPHRV